MPELLEERLRVVRRDVVLLAITLVMAGGRDGDDGNVAADLAQPLNEPAAGNVSHLGVEHDAVHTGKAGEQFDGLMGAVSGNYIELRGFNHQFAGGDAARILIVNHKKTWSSHVRSDVEFTPLAAVDSPYAKT